MFGYRRFKETLDNIIECLEEQDEQIECLLEKIAFLEKRQIWVNRDITSLPISPLDSLSAWNESDLEEMILHWEECSPGLLIKVLAEHLRREVGKKSIGESL